MLPSFLYWHVRCSAVKIWKKVKIQKLGGTRTQRSRLSTWLLTFNWVKNNAWHDFFIVDIWPLIRYTAYKRNLARLRISKTPLCGATMLVDDEQGRAQVDSGFSVFNFIELLTSSRPWSMNPPKKQVALFLQSCAGGGKQKINAHFWSFNKVLSVVSVTQWSRSQVTGLWPAHRPTMVQWTPQPSTLLLFDGTEWICSVTVSIFFYHTVGNSDNPRCQFFSTFIGWMPSPFLCELFGCAWREEVIMA